MKRNKIILSVVLTCILVCCSALPAYAYFTANTRAAGNLIIEPIHTTPHEKVVDKEKQLTIKNEEDGTPVYVRARGFAGDDSDLEYIPEEGWSDGGDGWWYYESILAPGELTTELRINISKVIPEDAEVGDSFNVAVVYESIRPVAGESGELLGSQASFQAFVSKLEGGN